MSQFNSSKNVFIQLDKENLSALKELSCNANLNELAQNINDAIQALSDEVNILKGENESLRLTVATLQTKLNLLQSEVDNLDIQDTTIDLDLGCLNNPCPTSKLSLLTILTIFKNKFCNQTT